MTLTRTFKIRFQAQGRDDEVRRLTVEENGLQLDVLRTRATQLFKLDDNRVWQFKWKDEDGDMVSLTEEYEFQDLMVLKRDEPLIRLDVHLEPQRREACSVLPFMRCDRPGSPNNRSGLKFGARCDVTNVKLFPDGTWYHKPSTRNDLCQEEFNKLSDEQKREFIAINQPSDLGDDIMAYSLGKHGRCPYRGGRGGGHHGRNFHCPRNTEAPNDAMGWCDVTDCALKVGQGWYHKVGTTYDLHESVFNTLPEEGKVGFVRVDNVADLGDEAHRYRFAPVDFSKIFQQVTVVAEPETTTPESPKKEPKFMEVISGPSVAPGAKIKAGSRIMPVWEVKNAGSFGLWTEVRLKPTSENPLKVPENGVEVPMLEAGTSGILSVDLVVPEDFPVGAVKTEFVLVDSDGDIFGEPLVLDIEVVGDEPVVDEKLRLLLDMGFTDLEACKSALAASNDDVSAAALALLRGSRK